MRFLASMWSVTLELAPWLLLGALISSLMHVLLPSGFIRKQLRGIGGVFKAVALGVPLPLCSCGVIPAGLGLRRDGASRGATVGFFVSTPQTGVDSMLVSASFLGWPFALFKVVSALVTGVLGGLVTEMSVTEDDDRTQREQAHPADGESRRSWRAGAAHADELLRALWRWLVMGIVISALISTFVPPQGFAALQALGTLGASLVVLALSIPLYVCATASVPIAAALVTAGMPAGAALVFLMAGPASNVATLGAVHRTFGTKTLAIYLLTVVFGSLGFALAFDWLLTGQAVSLPGHAHGAGWWEVGSALLLLAAMGYFAWDEVLAPDCDECTPGTTPRRRSPRWKSAWTACRATHASTNSKVHCSAPRVSARLELVWATPKPP